MSILIAEDELLIAYTIEEMLKETGHENVIIEKTLIDAENTIHKGGIKLAILDINLSSGSEGFHLAELCNEKKIPFIFISSYSDKSMLDKAIKTSPAAYLVKPVMESSLYTAVHLTLSNKQQAAKPILEFKSGNEHIKLPLDELHYLKAENIYVNVICKDKSYLFRGSLNALMSLLPEGSLIQTHRAFAINPMHVSRVSATYLVIQDTEIPISRNFKNQIKF